jgi:membrane protein YqaA with SNARE-associated domain
MLERTVLLVSMVTNGIVLLPPSEALYFHAYYLGAYDVSVFYFVLPVANTVGHVVLFALARSRSARTLIQTLLALVPVAVKAGMLWLWKLLVLKPAQGVELRDRYGWITLYGRLIPVVKTCVSVVLAETTIPLGRYVILTLLGNVFFAIECLVVFAVVARSEFGYLVSIGLVGVVFCGIYAAHILTASWWKSRS